MIGEISPSFDGYGFSLRGRTHVKNDMPCQDSHLFATAFGKWQLVAVADGVGSAPRSNKGAKCALDALAFRCRSVFLHEDEDGVLDALRAGFDFAMSSVETLAQAENRPLSDYDTTLAACLYDGETIFYGQSGDGGIVALDENGHFHVLTSVQKGDAWNEVCPLRFGKDCWEFGRAQGAYSAAALFTDGLLDCVVPPLLSLSGETVYRRFASLFLPREVICSCEQAELTALERTVSSWLTQGNAVNETERGNSGEERGEAIAQILQTDDYAFLTDDLTAAVIWKRGAKVAIAEESYFDEPDWEALRAQRFTRLYPNLDSSGGENDAIEVPQGDDTVTG